MTEVAIVTRPVGIDEPHNYLGRAAEAGERFIVFELLTYGSVDTEGGIALTEQADGGYPFFEFPLSAVRIVNEEQANFEASPAYEVAERDAAETAGVCQAKVPLTAFPRLWVICGEPATEVRAYRCSCDHVRQGASCADHAPVPGKVGCAQCFDQGHECPMEVAIADDDGTGKAHGTA